MNEANAPTPSIDQAAARVRELEAMVSRAIIGQRDVIRETIVALIAGGHVLVEGLPGLGKTLLVRSLSKAVGGKFSRIQLTPDLMPSDVTGHAVFDMKEETFRIRRGPIFCNFLLGDEINRAPAKTQSALLEAMQEEQVTIEGKTYELEQPFLVMATQNPIEQEGTYPLPQAQLDRFLINVQISYPSEEEESEMIRQVTATSVGNQLDISSIEPILTPGDVLGLQRAAVQIEVDKAILDYIVRIVRTTRDWQGIETGAGPRAGIALLRCARAQALFNSNDFVTPDDVKSIAPAVLRHRVKLTADLEIEGYQPDDVLSEMLANVAAPRQ
ncbi:AAA family ATPase [Thiosocius teredinicola]|uniref:AAA family ATPase n=1 Tax=Thiosocius teredinicola TaxID=1973002 RepID=UPI000990D0CD